MDLLDDRGLFRRPCLSNRRLELNGDQVVLVKSGTGGNQLHKTATEQACSDEDHERCCDFARDQEPAQLLRGASARSARSRCECFLKIAGTGDLQEALASGSRGSSGGATQKLRD